MELLVAAANDQSGQAVRLIVILLLAVAGSLSVLTIWYWRFTDPRRRTSSAEEPTVSELVANDDSLVGDEPSTPEVSYVPAVTGQMPVVTLIDQSANSDATAIDEDLVASSETDSSKTDSSETDSSDTHSVPPPIRQVTKVDRLPPQEPVVIAEELQDSPSAHDSVLDEAAKTGEINLTDSQWDQLAEAVLGAIGWDEPNLPDEELSASPDSSDTTLATPDSVRSVGVVD